MKPWWQRGGRILSREEQIERGKKRRHAALRAALSPVVAGGADPGGSPSPVEGAPTGGRKSRTSEEAK